MSKLDPAQIRRSLASIPQWKRVRSTLRRQFEFADFVAAIRFVNAVARLAERAAHHPDIDIRWNRVTLVLTTHDEGGLTPLDFEVARKVDRLGAARS